MPATLAARQVCAAALSGVAGQKRHTELSYG